MEIVITKADESRENQMVLIQLKQQKLMNPNKRDLGYPKNDEALSREPDSVNKGVKRRTH